MWSKHFTTSALISLSTRPQLLLRQFPLFLQPLFLGIPTFCFPFEKLMADAFSRRFSFIRKTVTAFDLGRCIQGKKALTLT